MQPHAALPGVMLLACCCYLCILDIRWIRTFSNRSTLQAQVLKLQPLLAALAAVPWIDPAAENGRRVPFIKSTVLDEVEGMGEPAVTAPAATALAVASWLYCALPTPCCFTEQDLLTGAKRVLQMMLQFFWIMVLSWCICKPMSAAVPQAATSDQHSASFRSEF